jgi:hypothetical protein
MLQAHLLFFAVLVVLVVVVTPVLLFVIVVVLTVFALAPVLYLDPAGLGAAGVLEPAVVVVRYSVIAANWLQEKRASGGTSPLGGHVVARALADHGDIRSGQACRCLETALVGVGDAVRTAHGTIVEGAECRTS